MIVEKKTPSLYPANVVSFTDIEAVVAMDLPTLAQLKALRVVDLKERLASLGLPQSGE